MNDRRGTFYKRDPHGDIDKIFASLVAGALAVMQAEAKFISAERDFDKAQLNLRYCDIIAEIDGVVTRCNVNPGNNVSTGQGLMAVRSLDEIWVDANFKETQLRELRIGQAPVTEPCDVARGRWPVVTGAALRFFSLRSRLNAAWFVSDALTRSFGLAIKSV